MFASDRFNKCIPSGSEARGTLMGNWIEEAALRSAVGEGRCTYQRHIKRSGLLNDFTKHPSGVHHLDNTFERVCGSKEGEQPDRFQTTYLSVLSPCLSKESQPQRRNLRRKELISKFAKCDDIQESLQHEFFSEYEKKFRVPESYPLIEFRKRTLSRPPKTDPVPKNSPCLTVNGPSDGFRKNTEFSIPIQLVTRGGPFKDEEANPKNKFLGTLTGSLPLLRDAVVESVGWDRIKQELEKVGNSRSLVSVDQIAASLLAASVRSELVETYRMYLRECRCSIEKGKVRLNDVLVDLDPQLK